MTSLECNITSNGNIAGKPDRIFPILFARVILQDNLAEYYPARDMLTTNEISKIALNI